ncbi:hypothetical protein [Arcobacter roscoffensis]|uniref:Phage tail protein n=1 Tax=Arcobacter roscoffensis TaxID=2961520 RepID=A0ABY5E3P0_9BACT|nr:hypothetical protein [Arcobacter roscoffensis]UTJ05390.1 hypothetical protein NJU99_08925 [Arcobacter roscoffensis]
MESFLKVKVKLTRPGGTEVVTSTLFDVNGLGSQRSTSKKVAYDDTVFLNVGFKEYESINFQLPYGETAGSFHAEAEAAYDANELVAFEIEFNNKKTDAGAGTTISGDVKLTSYKPTNDDKALISNFSAEWEGQPTLTKAN